MVCLKNSPFLYAQKCRNILYFIFPRPDGNVYSLRVIFRPRRLVFVASGVGWFELKPERVTAAFWFIQPDQGCVLWSSVTSSRLLPHVTRSRDFMDVSIRAVETGAKPANLCRRQRKKKDLCHSMWCKLEKKECMHPSTSAFVFKTLQDLPKKMLFYREMMKTEVH